MKYMKGQITVINLIQLFIAFVLYMLLLPVLQQFINATVVTLTALAVPGDYTSFTIMILYVVPFVFLLALIGTAFQYAIPPIEGGRR